MSVVDENSTYYSMAFDGIKPVPLKVDPVTGRLLIDISIVSEAGTILHEGKIDENSEGTSLATDDNGVIRPFPIDNRNGFLYIDLIQA